MRSTSSTRRAAVLVVVAAALAVAHGKAPEPLPIRVVFQLQDPIDGLCLSPRGFAPCDTTTLWTVGVTSGRQSIVSFLNPGLNPAPEAQCLERVPNGKWDSFVRLGSCKASNSLKWNIKPQMGGAMVTADDNKQCVARQGHFARMQPCDFGYTALNVVEASLHERGFLLTTRDGTCFDGVRFRMCDPKDYKLYWGAALRFDSPKSEGYYSFFKFHQLRSEPGQKCLARESSKKGSPTTLAECSSASAKSWAIIDGKLAHEHGKMCVKRDDKTGAAKMQPCKEGGTQVSWKTADQLRF